MEFISTSGDRRHLARSRPAFKLLTCLLFLSIAILPQNLCGADPQTDAIQPLLPQAKRALDGGDYARAIELYGQILQTDPGSEEGLLGMARSHLLSQQFKAALANYRLFLRRDPNNTEAQIGLGETYNLLRRYADAEGPLKRALHTTPNSANGAWALSRTYFYERRLQHAERLLRQSLADHPNDYRLWESLGEVQLEQGLGGPALQSLNHALNLNPKARRSQLLVRHLETTGVGTPIKVSARNGAYLLADGAGNQIMSFPQSVSLAYGYHLRDQVTGEYRRIAFQNKSLQSQTGNTGAGTVLSSNVTLLTDSAEVRINDGLTLIGGGGLAHYMSAGLTRPVYDAGFNFRPSSRLQLSYTFGQSIIAPTHLAASLGLFQRGWSSHVHYLAAESTDVDLTYYQDQYSDSNRLRGGHGEIRHAIWSQGSFRITGGYELESLSFANLDVFNGYFNPKRYIANSALISVQGRKGHFHLDYNFDLGEETYTRPVITAFSPLSFVDQRRSSALFAAAFRNSYDFTANTSLDFSALLYRSALSSGTGAYQAHAFFFALDHRF